MNTNRKKPYKLATTFALSLITASIHATPITNEIDNNLLSSPQRFIVHLNDSAVTTKYNQPISQKAIQLAKVMLLQATVEKVNAEVFHTLSNINAIAVKLTAEQKSKLLADANVNFIEKDPRRYLLSAPTLSNTDGESTPYGISMVQATQLSDSQSGNTKVCIMDTGYTLSHPDLPNNGITGDDGYGNNNTGNWYNDGNGHGTHVAGTIAALGGNNQGVVGVNPSGQLGLHIVKVFNDSGQWAYGSDIVAAINQCETAGANITSMSLGGGASSTAERQAFDNSYQRGMLHIAAAGNSGNSTSSYPASYDSVISVAAVDSAGVKASFSQYNAQVEIAAPGVGVNSTWNNNGYKSISGTSMATPHVSGVAALVWSNNLNCSNQEIRDALNATAEDKGAAGRDTSYGYGIVKAKFASDYLANSNCGNNNVDKNPIANFNHTINGKTVQFIDSSSDDNGIVSYLWSFGDGNSSTAQSPSHSYINDGIYQVTLTVKDTIAQSGKKSTSLNINTNIGSCSDYTQWDENTIYRLGDKAAYNNRKYEAIWWSTGAKPTVFTNVWRDEGQCDTNGNQTPIAGFNTSISGLSVSFSNTSTDDVAITSYAWFFGDGNTASTQNPNHSYTTTGTYQVSLTVTDEESATDTFSTNITVSEASQGCANLGTWSATSIYLTDTQVALNGNKYQANWWTKNQNPEQNSGAWQVWSNLGICN
ncbi:MAG: S8 family serine peptidase [Colwellia sp.]|nr:S8 family serine peptidase [Colwellia sp.]